jgi:hypothetical protein
MFAERGFLSFTEIPNPRDHRAYNEWHQLDHRPENMVLRGIVGGERWVRTPECAAASTAVEPLDALHYLNQYWFQSPADETIARWIELAELAVHWGRRDDLHLCRRLLTEHVRPLHGVAAPRIRVSADALAFRPNLGIHLVVTSVAEPRPSIAERHFHWWQHEYVPAQVARPGVAGCWTFASEAAFELPTFSVGPPGGQRDESSSAGSRPRLRVTIFYLDDDPLEVTRHIDRVTDTDTESVLFEGPLLRIVPWQWSWFDP